MNATEAREILARDQDISKVIISPHFFAGEYNENAVLTLHNQDLQNKNDYTLTIGFYNSIPGIPILLASLHVPYGFLELALIIFDLITEKTSKEDLLKIGFKYQC